MYRFPGVLFLAMLLLVAAGFSQNDSTDPRQLLNASINAMGGMDKLRAIRSIHTRSVGHIYLLEQSERPDGPWYVVYRKTEEWRDVENAGLRRTYEQTGVDEEAGTDIVARGVSVSDNGNGFAPNPGNIPPTDELLAMGPERILLNALSAHDLTYGGTKLLQGVPHAIVEFIWKDSPVKIYINRNTNLITMTDVVRARPTEQFWGIWGNFSEQNYYSYWNLQKGEIRYPQQVDSFYNGQPLRTDTILSMEINTDPPKNAFAISDEIRKSFAAAPTTSFPEMPLGRPDRPPVDIAPGFTVVRGNWNVTFVKQDDGIVIIEAPISSDYSAKVIAEAKKRFPNEKIKAVISTSDAFPHFGGLREYVAAGIPAYILDLNRPIVQRLIEANYRTLPDSLEKSRARRDSKFNIVSKKTVIGSGSNQLVLYPIRSESGERMIMIYVPQLKVLYGADLIQPLPKGGFFMPQYISELRDAVRRENLDVERVFAIHSPPFDWKKVLEALNDSEK